MNRFNEPIDDEFEKSLLFLKQGKLIFDISFKQALFEFFDKHHNDPHEVHDLLFNNFSLFWSGNGNILLGEQVYKKIIPYIHEWEHNNRPNRLHKGTPYYFYAVFCILKGDLEKGLLLMHQAYREDLNSGKNDTPASFFIKLDDKQPHQFFRQKVKETAIFLNSFLGNYQNQNGTTLSLEDLRNKFLGQNQFEEEAFFFVYCIFKLERVLKKIEKEVRKNRMASYIETTFIFELCKLAEVLLVNKYPANHYVSFPNRIDQFCQDNTVNLSLRLDHLRFVNREKERDFETTIQEILNHTFTHNNYVNNPSDIEYDLSLIYALRNFGGHSIEDQELIYQEFENISQNLLNAIFYITEKKY